MRISAEKWIAFGMIPAALAIMIITASCEFAAAPAPLAVQDPSAHTALQIEAVFASGTVRGRIADATPLRVGGRTFKASDIRSMEFAGNGRILLENGERISGWLESPTMVSIDLGVLKSLVDLSTATSARLERLGAESNVSPVAAPGPAIASVALPGPAENVVAGGAGRYLILKFPAGECGVFDAATRTLRSIEVPKDALLAAGREALLVVIPSRNMLERWNLVTLEREAADPLDLPPSTIVDDVAMGASSSGPLLVMTRQGVAFYDVAMLRKKNVPGWEGNPEWARPERQSRVRASADGSTFVTWAETRASAGGISVLNIRGERAFTNSYGRLAGRPIAPTADGKLLLAGNGVYSPNLERLTSSTNDQGFAIPSMSPAFFIELHALAIDGPSPGIREPNSPRLSIFSTSNRALLLTLPIDELPHYPNARRDEQDIENRVFYFPQSNLLVTLTADRFQLKLRRLELSAELKAAGKEFLFVSSAPPHSAASASLYRYAIQIESSRGGVTYRLESGPTGMRIDSAGVVTWQVPILPQSENRVVVSIKDASGSEVLHPFTISGQ